MEDQVEQKHRVDHQSHYNPETDLFEQGFRVYHLEQPDELTDRHDVENDEAESVSRRLQDVHAFQLPFGRGIEETRGLLGE